MTKHPLKEMLEKGMIATVNSDDPAYFGGYINENFLSVANALSLTSEHIALLAKNSFSASFLDEEEKQMMIEKVEKYFLGIFK